MTKKPAKKAPTKKKSPAKKKPAKKAKKFSAAEFWAAPMKKPKPVKPVAPEPKPVDPYHSEYDGTYTMKDYDEEENALKRWFENFKLERYVSFASEYECLIVEEVPASGKHIKKKQVCRIEHGNGAVRQVAMDHTAPPAPMVFFASKRAYKPPPPKTPADLRKEEEWHRMRQMGYSPRIRHVPVRKTSLPPIWSIDPSEPLKMETTVEFVEEIEWVRDEPPRWQPSYQNMPSAPAPAPRHRRN